MGYNPFSRFMAKGKPRAFGSYCSSKKALSFFERRKLMEYREKYWTIYEQGGYISNAVDKRPSYMLKNGYRLEGDDDALNERMMDFLDEIDFESCVKDITIAALVQGEGYQEKVRGRGNGGDIVDVGHGDECDVKKFATVRDKSGRIMHFEQSMGGLLNKRIPFRQQDIIYLKLPSMIHRAFDDIIRDTKTAEATAAAIMRHGFGKFHIRVGMPGEPNKKGTVEKVGKLFENLKVDNEVTTHHDVEVNQLDKDGIPHVDKYNDATIMRCAAALNTPEEVLGLRRGSTDATAVARIQDYYGLCEELGRVVARRFNRQLLNDKLEEWGRKPGEVKVVFNDVDPADENTRAEGVAAIAKATPADPFAIMTRAEQRERLGLPPDPEGEDDYDLDDDEGGET